MIDIKYFKENLIGKDNITKAMFTILRDNMINIIPHTFSDYDSDYKIFLENCIKNAIEEYKVKNVIAFNGEEVVAYLQYFLDKKSNQLFIWEIQISKAYQGDHKTFPKLISTMISDEEYDSINMVGGYINNKNTKSIKAFTKIGFKECYEKNDGKIYASDKKTINKWLCKNW